MVSHIISRIAVWLLAIVMIVFGIQHFRHPREMIIFVPSYLPGDVEWVYLVGGAFIVVAVALLVNRFVAVAAYLLAAMLLIFVVLLHWPNYRQSGDAEMRQLALVNLLKDTAIAAFALFIAANAKNQRLTTV